MDRRLIGLAAAWTGLIGAASPEASRLDLTLRPVLNGGEVAALDVSETIEVSGRAGVPLFEVPARVTTVPGQPYAQGDVSASDAAGPLPLRMAVEPAPASAPIQMRTFTRRAKRAGW